MAALQNSVTIENHWLEGVFLLRWTRRRICLFLASLMEMKCLPCVQWIKDQTRHAVWFVRLPGYDFWLFQKPVFPEISAGSYFYSPQNTKVCQYFSLSDITMSYMNISGLRSSVFHLWCSSSLLMSPVDLLPSSYDFSPNSDSYRLSISQSRCLANI